MDHVLVKILKDVCFKTHEIASKMHKKYGWGTATDPTGGAYDAPQTTYAG